MNIPPTIAVTSGQLRLPEVAAAISNGALPIDGMVAASDGTILATKIAIDPVWHLPSLAERLSVTSDVLRQLLFDHSGGAFSDLLDRPELELFLPPIGGSTVYLFGDPRRLGALTTNITCRIHYECNASDVFGSTLCTCRPYLAFAVEEAVRQAQSGGVGVIVYCRQEGRGLGEVTKFLVYNSRARDPAGDRSEDYFDHTLRVAGVADVHCPFIPVDILNWLGIRHIAKLVSMSTHKRKALEAGGITVGHDAPLPEDRIPSPALVEFYAKTCVRSRRLNKAANWEQSLRYDRNTESS